MKFYIRKSYGQEGVGGPVQQTSHYYLGHIGAMNLAENNCTAPADETMNTLTKVERLCVPSSPYI